jgi:hypothetical protein
MTNIELGRGTGEQYDILILTDGMTIAGLRTQIAHLPGDAKICINEHVPERISKDRIRTPILVHSGRLAGENNG